MASSATSAEPPDPSSMPLLEHLRELRLRLRNAIIALAAGTIAAYAFHEELFAFLVRPLTAAWAARKAVDPTFVEPSLQFASLIEPFWAFFSLSLWAGIFVSSPFVFHQLWRFVAPGLYGNERRVALPFAALSGLCFVGGAAFCYYLVLPVAYEFMLSYADRNIGAMQGALADGTQVGQQVALQPMLLMQQYLDLSRGFMLGFGIIFELPLIIFFLSAIGAVTHRGLWRFNRWAVVLSFVVGAVLTPGPDIPSQLLMAGPLVVLYNVSILIAYVVTKRRERREAAERARDAELDAAERAAALATRPPDDPPPEG
jgi:sec-independent protein translocase protein TatC